MLHYKYYIFWSFIIVSTILWSNLSSVYLLLCIPLSFYSSKNAIISILVSWLVTNLNPGLAIGSEINTLLKYLLYFSIFFGLIIRMLQFNKFEFQSKELIFIGLFSLYSMISAYFVSVYFEVSLLKIILFFIGIVSVMRCINELKSSNLNDLKLYIHSLFIIIILFSLPLIFSEIGYTRNGRGFQGILNQPQLFGTLFAFVTSFFVVSSINDKSKSWFNYIFILTSFSFILLSGARTGLLALILGIIASKTLISRARIFSFFKKKKVLYISIPVLIVIIFNIGTVITGLSNFLMKNTEGASITESLESSRGDVFYLSLDNFIENPILGIGFGIGSISELMIIKYDPYFNLPISASVEKSVAPMAILEETGIIGGFLFGIFIWFILKSLLNNRSSLIFPVLVIIFINFGESLIFSFNGHAGLFWIMIFFSVKSSNQDSK